jgi:hypothetical protein
MKRHQASWRASSRAAALLLSILLVPAVGSALNCPGCSSFAAPSPAPAGAAPAASGAAARSDATTRSAVTFDKLTDRVRKLAAAAGPPVDPKDPVVREALDTLVAEVKAATGRNDFELPVTLDDVASVTEEARPQEVRPGVLWVCRGGATTGATRAVILADGNVSVAYANECVIVARGAVDVSHGADNVIVAGQFIQVSHDGNALPGAAGARPGKNHGSLLVCGGPITVSHAKGTTLSSPGAVDLASATDATFLNSPKVKASHQQNCTTAKSAAALTLAPKEPANPIAEKLNVTQVLPSDRAGQGGVVVTVGGVELVVREGNEVRDGAGKPVPELAGWKLSAIGERFAVFSDGKQDALFQTR